MLFFVVQVGFRIFGLQVTGLSFLFLRVGRFSICRSPPGLRFSGLGHSWLGTLFEGP